MRISKRTIVALLVFAAGAIGLMLFSAMGGGSDPTSSYLADDAPFELGPWSGRSSGEAGKTTTTTTPSGVATGAPDNVRTAFDSRNPSSRSGAVPTSRGPLPAGSYGAIPIVSAPQISPQSPSPEPQAPDVQPLPSATGVPMITGEAVPIVEPEFFGAALFEPLPGATSRGVAFSEWESYRTDVTGRDILVVTDDTNFFKDREGKVNGNTGDTDASGLNVLDATDSIIHGSESADSAPWQQEMPGDDDDEETPDDETSDEDTSDEETSDEETPDEDTPDTDAASLLGLEQLAAPSSERAATAAVFTAMDEETPDEGFDFPYTEWLLNVSRDTATAVHTDEGTTLASGADALVIGGDGYDDDDNRAAGANITIGRDDGNIVIGGTGQANGQIGDSEQGAVIMDVHNVFIQGGGAY